MKAIGFVLILTILPAYLGAIYGDVGSNYRFLYNLTGDYLYSLALGYAVSMALVAAELMKHKKAWIHTARGVLIVTSAILSIGNFVLLKVQTGDNRLVQDAKLVTWTEQRDQLQTSQLELLNQSIALNNDGIAWNDKNAIAAEKKANQLQPQINRLNQQISARESTIIQSGNQIDQGFAGFGGIFGTFFIILSYPVIGVACPVAISILSRAIMLITGISIQEPIERQIQAFGAIAETLLNSHPGIGFLQLNDPLISKHKFYVSIIAVEIGLRSVESGKPTEVAEFAARLSGRNEGPYSASFVSEVKNGKYLPKLEKNKDVVQQIHSALLRRIKSNKLLTE